MDARRDRYELKYPATQDTLEPLRRALEPFVVRDRHTPPGKEGYTIHSIYFDTPSFDSYHQKVDGLQHRYKVRLRGYNEGADDAPVVLEIKRKDDRVVSKTRAWALHRDLDALLTTGDVERYALASKGDDRAKEDMCRFLYRICRHGLRPVVLTRYEREAYFGRFNDDLRITLDSSLRSRAFPGATELFGRQPVVRGTARYGGRGQTLRRQSFVAQEYRQRLRTEASLVLQVLQLPRRSRSATAIIGPRLAAGEPVNDFQDVSGLISPLALSPQQAATNLAVALVCGLMVARFYRWVTHRSSNANTFVSALIVLAMITCLVIMVIGNNLARAFGLVGAMSIIRFRTAVKDVRDIVFIFFSLAGGMAAGVGLAAISLGGTMVIGLAMLGVEKVQSRSRRQRDYLLQMTYTPSAGIEAPYPDILRRFCRRHHLVNTQSQAGGDDLELSFYVSLRNEDASSRLVSELRALPQIGRVNLFFDEDYD